MRRLWGVAVAASVTTLGAPAAGEGRTAYVVII